MAAPQGSSAPLVLVWGEDDFAVEKRARQVYEAWTAVNPSGDAETIDGTVANGEEVVRVLSRLREALQTLPFFGGPRAIWLRRCTFLGDDRVSEGQAVLAALAELARELPSVAWTDVRLVISASKVDRRRGFYKAVEKLATVEHFPGISAEDRDWQDKAENLAAGELQGLGKRIRAGALARFVAQVGPNARMLAAEAQKLAAYVGERPEVDEGDVETVVTRGRHARAFALGDAVGDRHLARALRCLDEELWAIRSDRQRSEIGVLYGLIGKVRAMLLAKEMIREGWIRVGTEYPAFAAQLKRLPPDRFPADKRYNPLAINAYVLYRAAQQAGHYSTEELVGAIEELLACNQRLVGSMLDPGLVLQMAVTRIVGAPSRGSAGGRSDARLEGSGRRAYGPSVDVGS